MIADEVALAQESAVHTSETLRIVVLGLTAVAILAVLSVTLLAFFRRPVPGEVIGVGSAAVGALATLLARVGQFNGARP